LGLTCEVCLRSVGYGVNAVIGNLLGEHQDKVTVFVRGIGQQQIFERTAEEKKVDADLEAQLIPHIAKLHQAFIDGKPLKCEYPCN